MYHLDHPGLIVLGCELAKDRREPSAIRDGCAHGPTTVIDLSVLENPGDRCDGRARLFDGSVAPVQARHISQRTVPSQKQHATTEGSFDRRQ